MADRSSEDPGPGRRETIAAIALLGGTILLHLVYAFRWTVDSDEWQHLHAAWIWTQGLLPYRDLFDNHAPLFHMLTAPLVAMFGETPAILPLMRLAITPFYLTALTGSAAIAFALFGRRAALWAPVVLAAEPVFFFRSIEYRADALWMTLTVLAATVLVSGEWGPARVFVAGLLLGLALCTSLKTVLLLFAMGAAALLAPWLSRGEYLGGAALSERSAAVLRSRARLLVPALAGMLVPVVSLALYFAWRGDLGGLVHYSIEQNILPGLGIWKRPWRPALFLPEIAFVGWIAGRVSRRHPAARRARVAFLTFAAGAFLASLQTLWPLFTTYDLLVFFPLVVPAVVGTMLPAPGPGGHTPRPVAPEPAHAWRFPALAVALLGIVLVEFPPWREDTSAERAFLGEVLRITDDKDLVLDKKGDAIFRNRPSPYVLERITLERLARGLLPDDIPEEMIATGTCVAALRVGGFPTRTANFLRQNFLPIDHLWVAGRLLPVGGSNDGVPGSFDIAIPATYALIAEGGEISGTLDGQPYVGPRRLAAGRHTFRLESRGSRAAVIWAQAVERGFSPFQDGTTAP